MDNKLAAPGTLRLENPGRPLIDPQVYRDTIAGFGVSACVVTAQHNGLRLGRTVTSLLSLSLDPPSILVSIDSKSELAKMIGQANRFSFAILSETQSKVADAFAGTIDPSQRFDIGKWSTWPSGQPRLEGASVVMDCVVVGEMHTHSNILFAGGVADVATNTRLRPLIWHQRGYTTVHPIENSG